MREHRGNDAPGFGTYVFVSNGDRGSGTIETKLRRLRWWTFDRVGKHVLSGLKGRTI
jgi:hypothetical protein